MPKAPDLDFCIEDIVAAVKGGMDINEDLDGVTLLMLAASGDLMELDVTLFVLGVEALHQGSTLLRASRSIDVVNALLHAGADINARNEYGHTALTEAEERNENTEIIKVLLNAGADV